MSHGRPEAGHAVFEEIVGGAFFYACHRDFFIDAAGDDDERNIKYRLLQQLKRPLGVELRQVMVRQYDVGMAAQRRGILCLRVDSTPRWIEAGTPQFIHHELGIGGANLRGVHATAVLNWFRWSRPSTAALW